METAKNINAETVATDNCALSDELVKLIIEREEYAEQNPDCWIEYEQAMKELRKF